MTEERFKDEGCNDGDPCFEEVGDGSVVGTKMFQDVNRQFVLEVPFHLIIAIGKMTARHTLSTER